MIESEPRCAVNAIRAALEFACKQRCSDESISRRPSECGKCPLAAGFAELAEVDKMLEAGDTMAAQLEATNGALGIGLPSSVAAYRAARGNS
jgi:hypothetical protein